MKKAKAIIRDLYRMDRDPTSTEVYLEANNLIRKRDKGILDDLSQTMYSRLAAIYGDELRTIR